MNTFYFILALGLIQFFYIVPLFFNFENPRPFVKSLSFVVFLVGIISLFEIKFKNKLNPAFENELLQYKKKEILFILALLFSFGFAYLYILFQYLDSFFLADFDFLAIAEILNNSISGKFFITHHYGNDVTGNYLSHHFSPSLLLLSFFLYFSNTRLGYAYGLLFFILLSFILLAILLLKKNIRGNHFYYTMILISFNLYLHRLFFSYHFELLIVFFILLFFVGKEFQSILLSIISILLLVFLKEDMSIYTFCLGLYFLIQKEWKYAFSLTFFSLFYFLIVPPYFQSLLDQSTRIDWLKDWSQWGNSYHEILINLFKNPFQIVNIFYLKWKVLRDLVLSFSPLIFISPSIILVSLPILLIHFMSSRIWYNSLYNYYSYTVVTFFIFGLIFSISKIKKSKYSMSYILFAIFLSLYTNSGDKFYPFPKIETDNERVQNVIEVVSKIQKNKTIATQFDLGGFIPRTNPLYPLHEKNLDKDYLLIDTNKGVTPYVDKKRIEKMIQDALANEKYSLLLEKDGMQLYKKN